MIPRPTICRKRGCYILGGPSGDGEQCHECPYREPMILMEVTPRPADTLASFDMLRWGEVARYRALLNRAQNDLYLCRLHDVMTDKAEISVKIALDHLWWAQGEKDAW